MKLLQEMVEMNKAVDTDRMNAYMKHLEERYIRCIDKTSDTIIAEGVGEDAQERAGGRLSAAKRGLGLVNKLKYGLEKTKNRSRVMGNLNRARGEVFQVDKTMKEMEEISKRFEAARRGLGLVNKLKAGPEKKKHSSRIMGNLNKIRGMLRRLEKQLSLVD